MVTAQSQIFAHLDGAQRIWAVAAIHGNADRLKALHEQLLPQLTIGDRLVYLGNYLGIGDSVIATIDQLLDARAQALCIAGMEPWDIVYLRGSQEEMWDKLLQLQFATSPGDVLDWMCQRGVSATVEAYGGNADMGRRCARDGAIALTKWTTELRDAMRAHEGHDILISELKRAAISRDWGTMFVNAGLDWNLPLEEQRDAFWWGGDGFDRHDQPFGEFQRVVRGYDPGHGGKAIGTHTVTVDGGCGRDGTLNAACMDPTREVIEWIEV